NARGCRMCGCGPLVRSFHPYICKLLGAHHRWCARRIRNLCGFRMYKRSWHMRSVTPLAAFACRDLDIHGCRHSNDFRRPACIGTRIGRMPIIFVAGLLFGLGLAVSGMINPAKVSNFLDVAGTWDPTLIFVMVAAVAIAFAGYRLVLSLS